MDIVLDAIDRRILRELQKDSTIAIAELAQLVGLSQTPCWKRIKRLTDAGIITKRVALLDRSKLDLGPGGVRLGPHQPPRPGVAGRLRQRRGRDARGGGVLPAVRRHRLSDEGAGARHRRLRRLLQAPDRRGAAVGRQLRLRHGADQVHHGGPRLSPPEGGRPTATRGGGAATTKPAPPPPPFDATQRQ